MNNIEEIEVRKLIRSWTDQMVYMKSSDSAIEEVDYHPSFSSEFLAHLSVRKEDSSHLYPSFFRLRRYRVEGSSAELEGPGPTE